MEKFEDKIEKILEELTLDEKIAMVHGCGFFRTSGVDRLGIPSLVTSDGPMGVRNQFHDTVWRIVGLSDDYVTYNPSNSALAATFNPDCAYESGKVLGEEARGRGKDVILAPGINIKRDPLCGRNFEYMSEDPTLVATMVVPFIKGVQENDVAACVKHLAVNCQETDRLAVDTIVDERTLHELYLPGFKAAVCEANSYSIMNAYNRLNGPFCGENKPLLDEILRKKWGYDGVVISDWGSIHSTKETAETTMDIEMSVWKEFDKYYLASPLKKAILDGEVKEEHLDNKIRNILRLMYRTKMIGEEAVNRKKGSYATPEHAKKTYEVAKESIILLKNENVLPITEDRLAKVVKPGHFGPTKKKIALIGCNANRMHANGGGSAEIKALHEVSPILGIKSCVGGEVEVVYAMGYYAPEHKKEEQEINWQETSLEEMIMTDRKEPCESPEEIMKKKKELFDEAIALCKEADEVIYVGGLNHDYDVEGCDRDNMELPYDQDKLINAILDVNENAVIVMVAGSPVQMPWADKAKAIVWSYYAGMESGHALADVLFGNVNPSGKLPESFPRYYTDTVTYKNGEMKKPVRIELKEGIFSGYRYYEKENIKPLFAFGHGLSYTDLAIENVSVDVCGKDEVCILCDVVNHGSMDGAEVVQCYVEDVLCSVPRPMKELKGFKKVFVPAGMRQQVKIMLDAKAFSFYDINTKDFVVEPGEFKIHIGNASDNCKVVKSVIL